MADLHTYQKLPSDPCLTQDQITAYIDGKLSSAEQHACEQHMLDCEMCEDAVEGLSLVKDRSVLTAPFTPLTSSEAPAEGKVISLQEPKRKLWYAAAAILVLVLGTTFVLRMTSYDGDSTMAEQQNGIADSTSISAPAEGYTMETGKKPLGDCLVNENNLKTAEESSIGGQTYAERAEPQNAPKVAPDKYRYEVSEEMEEAPVATDEALGDADGSLGAGPETVASKNEDARLEKTQVTQQEAQDKKKKTLLEFAKDGLAAGSKSEQKQDAFFDDNRSNDVAKPNATNAPAQPNVSQTTTQGASGNADYMNAGGVDTGSYVLSEVTTVTVADSIAVDQLELSYRNGVTQLNAGQANSAIVLFDKVLTDKNHARYEDAEFQKAKALIKANRKEEAKTLLKAIEAKKGKHAADATELLKTL